MGTTSNTHNLHLSHSITPWSYQVLMCYINCRITGLPAFRSVHGHVCQLAISSTFGSCLTKDSIIPLSSPLSIINKNSSMFTRCEAYSSAVLQLQYYWYPPGQISQSECNTFSLDVGILIVMTDSGSLVHLGEIENILLKETIGYKMVETCFYWFINS